MAKNPAKNVNKLIAAQTPKPKKKTTEATLPQRFKRKPVKRAPKPPPKNVLKLITDALKKKG